MPNVGTAFVTLMPSMSGFAGKVASEFGGAGTKAGKSFGDSMTSGVGAAVDRSGGLIGRLGTIARGVGVVAAAGMTALTGAVTAIGGAALSAYADYEQLVGGVDTLFGSASGQLQAYAADAYKTCGLSANQYMTQATSFAASLVSSCGGDVSRAADYANMAMGDMSDNVNKMGSDMVDVQNAYQGFAKQNYTMLDNLKLGYGGTKEEMERLISDANRLRAEQGKNADLTIDSYADVVEAIHTVQESMGVTGTTAEEAATTISGSIGMAKAAWENFVTGLGRDDVDFSQLTEQLLSSIGSVAKNVAPRVAQIGDGIIQAFPVVLSGLGTVLAPVLSEAVATAWNVAVRGLAGIGIHLPEVDASQILAAFQVVEDVASAVAGVVRTAFEGVGAVLASVASSVAGAASGAVGAVAPLASYLEAQLLPAGESLASGLGSALSSVWQALTQLGQAVVSVGSSAMPVLRTGFELVVPLVSQAVGIMGQLASVASPLVTQVASVVMPALTSIGTALSNLANAVLPGLAAAAQVVLSVAQALVPVVQTVLTVAMSVVSVVATVVAQVVAAVVNAAAVVASVISTVLTVVSGLVAAVTTFVGSILAVVGGCVSTVAACVSEGTSAVVTAIGSLVSSVLSTVSGLVSSIAAFFQSIVSTMSNAASTAYSMVTGAFSSMVGAVSGAVGSLMGVVSGIPGQIMGLFSGAGTWLMDSGRSIIDGLVSGIKSAVGGAISAVSGVVSQIRSFFPFSPAKRGPFSGHGYTTFSGRALMEGWAEGIGGGAGSVTSAIAGAMETAQGMLATGLTVAPVVSGLGIGEPARGGDTYYVNATATGDQQIIDAVRLVVSRARRQAGAYA